eukprot:5771008-Alexandrium_andersonii.AAC.1
MPRFPGPPGCPAAAPASRKRLPRSPLRPARECSPKAGPGVAVRARARIITQDRVTIARAVGGAKPLARPETQTARGCTPHEVTRLRRGERPTTQAARAGCPIGSTRRSHAQAAREPEFGGLDVL